MTADDAHKPDAHDSMLLRIAGDEALRGLDPAEPLTGAFLDWWARELRARRTVEEEASDGAAADAFAARALARVAAARTGIRVVRESAPREPLAWPLPASSLREPFAGMRRAPMVELEVAAGAGRALWDEECTHWVAVPADMPDGEHIALHVRGESMFPLLEDGDTILVRLGRAAETGTVVVVRRPDDDASGEGGGYVVKRVGRLNGRTMELVSLNPDFAPLHVPRDPALVLGTVVMRWAGARGT